MSYIIDLKDFPIKPLVAIDYVDKHPKYFRKVFDKGQGICSTSTISVEANGIYNPLCVIREEKQSREVDAVFTAGQLLDETFKVLLKDEKSLKLFWDFMMRVSENPYKKYINIDELGSDEFQECDGHLNITLDQRRIHNLISKGRGHIEKGELYAFPRSVFFAKKYLSSDKRRIPIGKVPLAFYSDNKWEPHSENFVELLESYYNRARNPSESKILSESFKNAEFCAEAFLHKGIDLEEFRKPRNLFLSTPYYYNLESCDSQLPMDVDELLPIKGEYPGPTAPISKDFTIN